MITQTYSTGLVPHHERFDYWREVICRNFFGMTTEVPRPLRDDFNGFMRVSAIGDSELIEVRSSPSISRRLERDIADAVGNAFFIYVQTSGACHFETSHRKEFVTRTDAMAVTHSDMPFVSKPMNGDGFHFRLVKLPFSRLQPGIERSDKAPPHLVDPRASVEPLLRSYFDAFFQAAPNLDGLATDIAVQTLANLATLTYGIGIPEDESRRESIQRAKRQRIVQYIDQNLHDAALTPGTAARALGMSIRQLHMLFEPTGVSFSQRVRTRRLARVRSMLMRNPAAKITDVALACGFESPTTFHRAFSGEFGMSPVELRAAMLADDASFASAESKPTGP